jgi:hypothetical protein
LDSNAIDAACTLLALGALAPLETLVTLGADYSLKSLAPLSALTSLKTLRALWASRDENRMWKKHCGARDELR